MFLLLLLEARAGEGGLVGASGMPLWVLVMAEGGGCETHSRVRASSGFPEGGWGHTHMAANHVSGHAAYCMSTPSRQGCLLRGADTHGSIRGVWTHVGTCLGV